MRRYSAAVLGLAFVGAIAVVAFAVFEAWVYTHREDAPPVDDSDLATVFQRIPAVDNGRAILIAAAGDGIVGDSRTKDRLRELREAGEWDPDLARDRLAWNAGVLAALDRAIAAPGYQRAERVEAPDGQPVPFSYDRDELLVAEILELCIDAAVDRAHAGSSEAAVDGALRCLRLARRQATMGSAQAIEVFTAVEYQGSTVTALGLALPRIRVTAADSRHLEIELAATRIPGAAWRDAWAEEYRRAGSQVRTMPAPPVRAQLIPLDYSYQPNRSRALLADAARWLRASAENVCSATAPYPVPDPFSALRGLPRAEHAGWPAGIEFLIARLKRNGLGEYLHGIHIEPWNRLDTGRCRAATFPGVAAALLALRAHALERGALPASLEALVPAYLSRIPVDGYDGAPLRYSRAKRLLWSVGDDLRDDGGVAPEDADERAEPSWPITF